MEKANCFSTSMKAKTARVKENVMNDWMTAIVEGWTHGKTMSAFSHINIARGTTDPEIDSVSWTKFGNNMAPLAQVANLATRWRHLQ